MYSKTSEIDFLFPILYIRYTFMVLKRTENKFGSNAYFTDLTISYNRTIGSNIIGVTVTEAPKSLKMGQWNLTQNIWKKC
ncbi:hypothetical protein [Aquimarina atlantica]|uniref:hypothetical protein n=1 Tax=Aquimarina atlantica TaxID=1317122 RepID=UPI000553E06E|nr:hypothetical protein [Aquimarina atlantica]